MLLKDTAGRPASQGLFDTICRLFEDLLEVILRHRFGFYSGTRRWIYTNTEIFFRHERVGFGPIREAFGHKRCESGPIQGRH